MVSTALETQGPARQRWRELTRRSAAAPPSASPLRPGEADRRTADHGAAAATTRHPADTAPATKFAAGLAASHTTPARAAYPRTGVPRYLTAEMSSARSTLSPTSCCRFRAPCEPHAVVAARERARDFEADALVAVAVGMGSVHARVKHELVGDGEPAGDAEPVTVERLDSTGLERDLREPGRVEEVRRAKVLVSPGFIGVHRLSVDLAVHLRAREVVADLQRSLELLELPANVGDAHVLDGEGDLRVRAVDAPCARANPGGDGRAHRMLRFVREVPAPTRAAPKDSCAATMRRPCLRISRRGESVHRVGGVVIGRAMALVRTSAAVRARWRCRAPPRSFHCTARAATPSARSPVRLSFGAAGRRTNRCYAPGLLDASSKRV